jgi:hypothetical protein
MHVRYTVNTNANDVTPYHLLLAIVGGCVSCVVVAVIMCLCLVCRKRGHGKRVLKRYLPERTLSYYFDRFLGSSVGTRSHLIPLHKDSPAYKEGALSDIKIMDHVFMWPSLWSVQNLLLDGWKHRDMSQPVVHNIFGIPSSEDSLQPFLEYQ